MGRTSRSPVSNLPAVANLSKLSSKLAVYAEHFGFMQRYLFGYSAPFPPYSRKHCEYIFGVPMRALTNGRGRSAAPSARRSATPGGTAY
jgi:hypothetical protein